MKNEYSWMNFIYNNIDIDDVDNNLHKLLYSTLQSNYSKNFHVRCLINHVKIRIMKYHL